MLRWRDTSTFALIALLAALLGPGLSLAQRQSPATTSTPTSPPTLGRPGALFGAVAALVDAGDFTQADAILRAALLENPDDDLAAHALRDLYRLPGVEAPVDQQELDAASLELGADFRRYDSSHFLILSDCDEQWTRERARLLEAAYHQFQRIAARMNFQTLPPQHRLLCILIQEHAAYTDFARRSDGVDAAWVAGYYASRANRVVFYNDATGPAFKTAAEQLDQFRKVAASAERKADSANPSPAAPSAADNNATNSVAALREQARRFRVQLSTEQTRLTEQVQTASLTKTIHEAIHLISFNCGLQSRARQYPFWLTEGLASSFETLDPSAAFGPDSTFPARDRELTAAYDDQRLIPLEAFVQLNSLSAPDADAARALYAQAHALFQYLFRFHRDDLAAYFRDIRAEPPGPITPDRHLQMFTARFGKPDRIERQWRRELDRALLATRETASADTPRE